MKIKVFFDGSGSMSEKKSEIFNLFFIFDNMKNEYQIDIDLYIWGEEVLNFEEPQKLKFSSKLNTDSLFSIIENDDCEVLIITDGCFPIDVRDKLKNFKERFAYLLVGEDSNVQAVKKISSKEIFRFEDVFSCINEFSGGAFQ